MFGENLKKLRNNSSITQQELAAKLKVSPSTIGMYESNKRMPDTTLLSDIASFFNVTIDYLLGRTEINHQISASNNNKILDAVKNDEELLVFTKELAERESMQLLFKQARPLSDDAISRIIRIIKAIEDEEDREDGV